MGVQYGTGRHAEDIIPPTNIPIGLKVLPQLAFMITADFFQWWWFCEQLYCLTCLTLKFSIGLFLLRIAVNKSQKIILWVVMIVSGLMSVYFFLLFLLQCRPIAFFWGQYTGMKGSCIDPLIISRTAYVYSAVSCWSDWTFCILPAFMIWNVQMNPRTKASVLCLFALGALWVAMGQHLLSGHADTNRASTTTIVRFPYLHTLTNKEDFLYATTNVGILSTCEVGIGIVASAAATLRPLFRRFLGRSQISSSIELPSRWPSCPRRAGYARNREDGPSRMDEEDIGVLRVQSHSTEGGDANMKGAEKSSEGRWRTSTLEDASSEEYRPAPSRKDGTRTAVMILREG